MIATYVNGQYVQKLQVETADLEELIMRCGWTIVGHIEGKTQADREEIERLFSLDYISAKEFETPEEALAWWQDRVISKEPMFTVTTGSP